MKHSTVAELLSQSKAQIDIEIKGWIRTFRANRFIALNDGSTINNIQCVIDFENTNESVIKKGNYNWCCCIILREPLAESQGQRTICRNTGYIRFEDFRRF